MFSDIDGPELTEQQLADILKSAFVKKSSEFDVEQIIFDQIKFLNSGANASYGKIVIEGPDGQDLGCARYNFETKLWEWSLN